MMVVVAVQPSRHRAATGLPGAVHTEAVFKACKNVLSPSIITITYPGECIRTSEPSVTNGRKVPHGRRCLRDLAAPSGNVGYGGVASRRLSSVERPQWAECADRRLPRAHAVARGGRST